MYAVYGFLLALIFLVCGKAISWLWPGALHEGAWYYGITNIKDFATHLALVAGVLWFMYQVFAGHELHNLSVKLESSRVRAQDDKSDIVVVKMKVEEGYKGTNPDSGCKGRG